MKKILEIIKETKNYQSIINEINSRFKVVDTNGTNEAYYKRNVTIYEVNPNVYLNCGSCFEYFGGSSTGGYFVSLKTLESDEEITLFDEDITTTNSGKERTIRTIYDCDYHTPQEVLELCAKNKSYNIEDFLLIEDETFVLPYWKGLSDEDKFDARVLFALLGTIYNMAEDEYMEILSYNDISPYGGEDISYFPSSVGECFYDRMQNLSIYFESEKELRRVVFEYLSGRDSEDAFIQKIIKEKKHGIEIMLNATSIREVLPTYFKSRMRLNRLEMLAKRIKEDIEVCSKLMERNEKELILCQYRLENLPKKYSFWEKLFDKKGIQNDVEKRKELEHDLEFFLMEKEEAKMNYDKLFAKLIAAKKKIKEISPFVETYAIMAREFLYEMYDEDDVCDMLNKEEFNIDNKDIDKYIEHMKNKVLAA